MKPETRVFMQALWTSTPALFIALGFAIWVPGVHMWVWGVLFGWACTLFGAGLGLLTVKWRGDGSG